MAAMSPDPAMIRVSALDRTCAPAEKANMILLRAFGGWLFERPYLLLTLTTLFWAGNAVAGKLAAGVIPPFTLTGLRWILTASILYLLARPLIADNWDQMKANWRFLFFCGAIGFAIFNFCLYGALNYTSAINVAIEQSGMPMVVILLAYLVFREPVTRFQLLGAAISILGVLITASRGDLMALLQLDVNIGDLIMLGGVLAYSVYTVALKRKPALPWQVFMFSLAIAAMITAFPAMLIELSTGAMPEFSWRTPALLAYVVIFPSVLSQIFFVRGVEMIGPQRAMIFSNLVPVFGSFLAVMILGEAFKGYHAVGLALVIGGIAMAELSARRRTA
jgi:drug/metabolite transporter (DMT)-like permease